MIPRKQCFSRYKGAIVNILVIGTVCTRPLKHKANKIPPQMEVASMMSYLKLRRHWCIIASEKGRVSSERWCDLL